VLVTSLLGAVLVAGCGSDDDEALTPVAAIELAPALRAALPELKEAGYAVEAGDLEVYGKNDVRVLLVDGGSDEVMIVYEGHVAQPPIRPAKSVVDVRNEVFCRGLAVAGPTARAINQMVEEADLCRGEL
jgi:hypothetical protein